MTRDILAELEMCQEDKNKLAKKCRKLESEKTHLFTYIKNKLTQLEKEQHRLAVLEHDGKLTNDDEKLGFIIAGEILTLIKLLQKWEEI